MSFLKKLLYTVAVLFALLLIFALLHVPILRFFGNQLVYENKMEHVPALFILSGGAWDRGNEAIRLYHEGYVEKIICTGENIPTLFKIAKIDYFESELTKMHLLNEGIPENDILLILKGTSTKEEADYILEYCRENNIKKLAVLSTKFHTERIKQTFKKRFEDEGLQLIIRGAPSSSYDENEWWKSENGLIFVNNEYIKIVYYKIRRFS